MVNRLGAAVLSPVAKIGASVSSLRLYSFINAAVAVLVGIDPALFLPDEVKKLLPYFTCNSKAKASRLFSSCSFAALITSALSNQLRIPLAALMSTSSPLDQF